MISDTGLINYLIIILINLYFVQCTEHQGGKHIGLQEIIRGRGTGGKKVIGMEENERGDKG